MQRIDGSKVVFVCPEDILEKVDKIAKRHGHTRSEAIRILLSFGSDVYGDFEAVGIVKLAEVVSRSQATIKRSIQRNLFA